MKRHHSDRALLLISFITVLAVSATSRAAEKPWLMGAMGDSITAATFAEHSAAGGYEYEPLVRHVPLLGDMENKATYSWASGQNIQSQFVLLSNWLKPRGESLAVLNTAVPGDRADSMPLQAKQLAQVMATGHYQGLLYVTVLIGANDACSSVSPIGTPDAQMEASLRTAFATLAAIPQPTPIHVLVAGIPKIPDLGKPRFTRMQAVMGLSCAGIQDVAHECPSMLSWHSTLEYDAKVKVVEDKNALLQRVVDDLSRKYANLELVYTDRAYTTPIRPSYLARDCFHPSYRGQQALAEELWQDQPWFK